MQPAEVKELVTIPAHVRFWGMDSGIRHRYESKAGCLLTNLVVARIMELMLLYLNLLCSACTLDYLFFFSCIYIYVYQSIYLSFYLFIHM